MNTTLTLLDGIVLVRVEGVVDSLSAGRLYDILARAVRTGETKLIIDVSAVQEMTRAGIRGIVVAAQMLSRHGGKTHICGANPASRLLLGSLGYDHLLSFDYSLPAALESLCPGLLDRAMRTVSQHRTPPAQPANVGWPMTA